MVAAGLNAIFLASLPGTSRTSYVPGPGRDAFLADRFSTPVLADASRAVPKLNILPLLLFGVSKSEGNV